jgi:diguanylate cyclase (GGDEF)-like protein
MRQTGDHNAVPGTGSLPLPEPARHPDAGAHRQAGEHEKVHVVRARHATVSTQAERQAVRVKRLLTTTVLGLMYMAILGIFYLQGLIEAGVLQIAALLVVSVFLLFRVCFALGWNLKAAEKSLRLPLTLSAIGILLLVLYLAPVTQFVFTPFLFLIMAVVMHRLSPRTMLLVALLALLGYACVVAAHFLQQGNQAMLTLECTQLLVLAITLPGFSVLAHRVQRLHNALFKANRKIRNIESDAQRDVLLGCFNRRYIVAALEQQKRLADESGTPLCLAVIDLDHFKRINDEAGHLGGDEVLRTFARIAQNNVREGDIFGRYGGEEFLLVLPETSLLAALNVAERIREQVEHYAWDTKLKNRVTVSIGLTQQIPGESVLDLFSRTDTAMYMAKQGGRNQVVVEEPALDAGLG